jgi:outer membrane lipoprotein-sorting protein
MILLVLFLTIFSYTLSAQNATEIIRKADEKMHGETSFAEMKMTVIRPGWKREMTMKAWSKGDDYSLILITGPLRDKGISFLKRKREMWNWQPNIERVVKMPPSMMSQSWMGSDFTNDDLIRQSSIVSDYEHNLLGEEILENISCFKIELIPKESSDAFWGKVIIWIDKKDFMELKIEFYDEDTELINTIYSKNIKKLGNRIIPSIMEIVPADGSGNKTIVEYLHAEFNQTIPDDVFSVQNLKKVK